MSEPTPTAKEIHGPTWGRVLRPFLWWVLLVLVLFAVRTHQRLSEKTRLAFSVSLQGRSVQDEVSARLDGKPVASGDRISIGWHKLAISHPKCERVRTNMFVWYGDRDLGEITLRRSTGTLAVEARPPARLLTIRGPEFSVTLTNSPGMTSSVPTDAYSVEARYAHSQERGDVSVSADSTAYRTIAPRLGAVDLACSHSETTFELLASDGRPVQAGDFPATISELPEGPYTLNVRHHRDELLEKLTVRSGSTNGLRVEFVYGVAVFETDPPGATVATGDGIEWGVTPVNLIELRPGTWKFNVRREGYEPVQVSLLIAGHETNRFRTNLVSRNYTGAMEAARQSLAAADYDRALEAAADALRAKPGDPAAAALQTQARGLGGLRRAERLGEQGDYVGAIKEVQSALKILPDSARAQELLAGFKKRQQDQSEAEEKRREQELAEKLRQEGSKRAEQVMGSVSRGFADADLFDNHEVTCKKPVKEVGEAVNATFQAGPAAVEVTRYNWPQSDAFALVAKQNVPGGVRQCLVVGSLIGENETRILFKVLEYETHLNVNLGGLLRVSDGQPPVVAVHPSRIPDMTDQRRTRAREGVQFTSAILQKAIAR